MPLCRTLIPPLSSVVTNNTYEHVFHFVKSRKYYYNLDAIRVPHKSVTINRVKKYIENKEHFDPKRHKKDPAGMNQAPTEILENSAKKGLNPLGKNPGDFWIINTRGFKGAHFAVYPEELLQRPILSSSRVEDIVLDPFIGSGTTAVVAKKFGRRFLGCDINPEYVKIAGERLRDILTSVFEEV